MPTCAGCGRTMERPQVREERGGRVSGYCSIACLRADLGGSARNRRRGRV